MSIVQPIIARHVEADLIPLVRGETPPARMEYLAAANERLLGAVCTPYAVPSLLGDLRTNELAAGTTSARWLLAVRHPVGARSFRPRLVFAASGRGGTHTGATMYSSSSGGTAADLIQVATPIGVGTPGYSAVDSGEVRVADGADSWVPSPAAAQNRLVELTSTLSAPSIETFEVDGCVGFGGEVRLMPDLLSV